MSKILNNKIYRIILCIFCIVSIFVVPSLLYMLFNYIGITNDIICSLLYMSIYSLILLLIFSSELKREWIIFKNNFSKSLDNGFKYWIIGMIVMIISNVIINLIIFKGNIATNEALNRQEILNSPFYYILFSMVIFGPIIEELILRKSPERIFKNKNIYILFSGIVFGFMHVIADLSSLLNLLYIIPYGALGMSFAIMNVKTKTVFTSIMMHMFHNLLTCLLLIAVL